MFREIATQLNDSTPVYESDGRPDVTPKNQREQDAKMKIICGLYKYVYMLIENKIKELRKGPTLKKKKKSSCPQLFKKSLKYFCEKSFFNFKEKKIL